MSGPLDRYKICAVRFRQDFPNAKALLCVDSGARKAGVAWFEWLDSPDQAMLLAAATISTKTDAELSDAVHLWADAHAQGRNFYSVVEVPKKRANKRRFHKDLDRLLQFIRDCEEWLDGWTLRLFPEQWKAQVGTTLRSGGKAPHHRRVRQALSKSEAFIFDEAGVDGRDAVGIGLYALGRTGRGGIRCPEPDP